MSKIPEAHSNGHNLLAAVPPARSGWPWVERRRNDRRQSDRRQQDRARPPTGELNTQSVVRLCTAREQQVLALLLQGMTNKQIAQALGIAEDTVKKHLLHAYRKVGVHRRALLMVEVAAHTTATGGTTPVE